MLGIGLYGLTYIYPVYLAAVRGYSSLMIGNTMFVTGACMFLIAPIVGAIMTRVDPRMMIAVGFIGFGIGTWQASYITADWDFWELLVPQMLRGFSLMLCMVPINNLSLGTMPPDKIKNASGLFNLTRNLGGAFGLALINTLLDKRMDLHLERLREAVHGAARRSMRRWPGSPRRSLRAGPTPRWRRPGPGDEGASAGRGDGARRRLPGADGDLHLL